MKKICPHHTPPRPHPLHCGDGRLVGQCLHASTCSQPPSNSSIHGLTLYLVLLAKHSHHSVLFSKSSSHVVTDSPTDTLLPLPLLVVPLLHESAPSSLELSYTASLDAQSNTICPNAMSLFAPRYRGYSRKLLARQAAATCLNSASFGPSTDPSHAAVTQPNACSRLPCT